MKIEDLKYDLGQENIATTPREIRLGRRDLGRMLVVNRSQKKISDSFVMNLSSFLSEGDTIIFNDSKRIPGLLKAKLVKNQAQVEIQFVELDKNSALCRIYPNHHIEQGVEIHVGDNALTVTETNIGQYLLCRIFSEKKTVEDILKEQGYPITSFFHSNYWETNHFNPFFSKKEGSVESPLAGLHFTKELLQELQDSGINIGYITLHSAGSWLPFLEENIEDHNAYSEWCEIDQETVDLINRTKKLGKKVIACGSTSMRTIETAAISDKIVAKYSGKTDLYIQPGYSFKIVDHYFTNFHPYKTSLMVLDIAFCGQNLLKKGYSHAKKNNYLFFEFGDAILYM